MSLDSLAWLGPSILLLFLFLPFFKKPVFLRLFSRTVLDSRTHFSSSRAAAISAAMVTAAAVAAVEIASLLRNSFVWQCSLCLSVDKQRKAKRLISWCAFVNFNVGQQRLLLIKT